MEDKKNDEQSLNRKSQLLVILSFNWGCNTCCTIRWVSWPILVAERLKGKCQIGNKLDVKLTSSQRIKIL